MSKVSAAIKRVEREFKNAEFICAIVFVNRVRLKAMHSHSCNGSKSCEGCLKRRQRHFSEALNVGIDGVYTHEARTTRTHSFFMASLKIDSFLQYHKCHSRISSYINKVVSIKLALISYRPCNSLVALKLFYRFVVPCFSFVVRTNKNMEFLVSLCLRLTHSQCVCTISVNFFLFFSLAFSFV